MGKEKKLVHALAKKYKTFDPFLLCDYLNITVRYANLGKTRGIYVYNKRNRFITINEDLDEQEQRIVCAHELGHAMLHDKTNRIYMASIMFTRPEKEEIEANKFAAHLLIQDSDVLSYEHSGYTLTQIAASLCVPKELLRLKVENITSEFPK